MENSTYTIILENCNDNYDAIVRPPKYNLCVSRGCPLWSAHGKGPPTGGGAHRKWVQWPNPAVPLIPLHTR